MAQTSLSSSFWATAHQRHAPASPAHGRTHASLPGSRQRMVAAERCRIFRYGKVVCSTATAAPDITTAEPLKPASEPKLSDLNTWIDSIEQLASTLMAAHDSNSKVCFAHYCTAHCCSTSGCPVWLMSVVLLQLELLRRDEQVRRYSQSSRWAMCVAQGCRCHRASRGASCVCVAACS